MCLRAADRFIRLPPPPVASHIIWHGQSRPRVTLLLIESKGRGPPHHTEGSGGAIMNLFRTSVPFDWWRAVKRWRRKRCLILVISNARIAPKKKKKKPSLQERPFISDKQAAASSGTPLFCVSAVWSVVFVNSSIPSLTLGKWAAKGDLGLLTDWFLLTGGWAWLRESDDVTIRSEGYL